MIRVPNKCYKPAVVFSYYYGETDPKTCGTCLHWRFCRVGVEPHHKVYEVSDDQGTK